MKLKTTILSVFLILFSTVSYAQLGIRAGVNMANELHSFNLESIESALQSENLTGFQAGLVYQLNPKKSGLGFEVGALFAQKGGIFKFDKNDVIQSLIKGYREVNYIEVPVNLRLKISSGGVVGLYGNAGIYGAYALKGKTVFESDIATLVKEDTFDGFMDRIDYGYSFGGGIELVRKLQIGVNYSQGLQKRDTDKSILEKLDDGGLNLKATNTSKVFSISLTYLF